MAIEEIDELLNHHTVLQIANILNERGVPSGTGRPFNAKIVARLQRNYCLKPRYDRLREAGLLTLQEMADALHVTPTSVKIWNRRGLIRGHAYSDKNEACMTHRAMTCPQRRWVSSCPAGVAIPTSYLIAARRCSVKRKPWNAVGMRIRTSRAT